MKFKDDFDKEILLSMGFERPNPDEHEEDFTLKYSEYISFLAFSRRGQCYYLIVSHNVLRLYATEADGSGGPIEFPMHAFSAIQELCRLNAFV